MQCSFGQTLRTLCLLKVSSVAAGSPAHCSPLHPRERDGVIIAAEADQSREVPIKPDNQRSSTGWETEHAEQQIAECACWNKRKKWLCNCRRQGTSPRAARSQGLGHHARNIHKAGTVAPLVVVPGATRGGRGHWEGGVGAEDLK